VKNKKQTRRVDGHPHRRHPEGPRFHQRAEGSRVAHRDFNVKNRLAGPILTGH